MLVGGFDAEDADVVGVEVLEGFDDEVLAVEREALAKLQNFPLAGISHLAKFNVLSGGNLPLLQNLLAVNIIAHLVRISVRIVFADLA